VFSGLSLLVFSGSHFRGSVKVITLTARSSLYRLYRHPLVMFGIGPVYNFVLRQRLPLGLMRSGWQPWRSTMATNIAIAIFVALLIWLVGVGPFLLVHLPITCLGASIGVWLFYVQHQFEDTYWDRDEAASRRAVTTWMCR
jgi:omega-6 fatty acid desaturase (delta-12 desaturase)